MCVAFLTKWLRICNFLCFCSWALVSDGWRSWDDESRHWWSSNKEVFSKWKIWSQLLLVCIYIMLNNKSAFFGSNGKSMNILRKNTFCSVNKSLTNYYVIVKWLQKLRNTSVSHQNRNWLQENDRKKRNGRKSILECSPACSLHLTCLRQCSLRAAAELAVMLLVLSEICFP